MAAVETKSLTVLTKSLGELADRLAYQLRPPYTEVGKYRSTPDDDRFTISFSGHLNLHYSRLERNEGLIFDVTFAGSAIADTPTPAIDELLYAAALESIDVYGYGARWKGELVDTPAKFTKNLEVEAGKLSRLNLWDLYSL